MNVRTFEGESEFSAGEKGNRNEGRAWRCAKQWLT